MSDQEVDDFLAHYGVPGMKWGRRKADTGAPSKRQAKKAARKERDQDILKARLTQDVKGRKMQEAQAEFIVARGAKNKDKTEKVMRKLQDDFYNGDNAKMAAQATRGEKASIAIFTGAAAVLTIASIASSR